MPNNNKEINVLKKYSRLFLILFLLVGFGTGIHFFFFHTYDKSYKETLLIGMGKPKQEFKKLNSIMGEKELEMIVKRYNDFPHAYMIDKQERGDRKVFDSKLHRANFHAHTTISDGKMEVEDFLTQAAEYADEVKKEFPNEQYPYILALTDHSRIEQDKIALKLIYENPEKYKNLKVVLGLEFWGIIEGGQIPSQKHDNGIHILAWAINPYEKAFENLEYREYPINEVFDFIQNQKYGLIGIAHPIREIKEENIADGKNIYDWLNDMLDFYASKKKNKMLFAEGYYQRYRFNIDPELSYAIKKECDKRGIKTTGSLDTHTLKIYEY